MLVLGWTINGTFGSSYINTMGFGVSARDQAETTLSDKIFSHNFLTKSICYLATSQAINSPPGGCYG